MDFAINLRSILLLIAMFQGLLIAGLLLTRGPRRHQTADFFLSGLLFFLACSLIDHFIGFMGVYDYAREHGHDLTFFPFGNPFTYGPFILLYTRALTDGQFRWARRDWLHFLLPLLFYIIRFSVWVMPDAEKFHFLGDTIEGAVLKNGIEIVFYIATAWYLWLSFRRFNTYRKLIEQEYANTGQIKLDWLRVFLYAFAIYLAFDFVFTVFGLVYDFWYDVWYWLNLTRALLLYYISATGWSFAQKSTVEYSALEKRELEVHQGEAFLSANSIPGKPVFTEDEMEKRRAILIRFMDAGQPWLDPELTLSSLAEQMQLNTTQLSFLINNGFQQNFNDFINTYRVQEVKRKMAMPDFQHLSLLGIAFESGFNSKATFNRAFKKLTGKAPSEHKREA